LLLAIACRASVCGFWLSVFSIQFWLFWRFGLQQNKTMSSNRLLVMHTGTSSQRNALCVFLDVGCWLLLAERVSACFGCQFSVFSFQFWLADAVLAFWLMQQNNE